MSRKRKRDREYKDEVIVIRVTLEQRTKLQRAAAMKHMESAVSAWMRSLCLEAADNVLGETMIGQRVSGT